MSARELSSVHAALEAPVATATGAVIGELVAIADDGRTPLVVDPRGKPAVASRARSIVDLRSEHIGQQVLLMFDAGDASRPVVLGVMRPHTDPHHEEASHAVSVSADEDRLVVDARHQIVLRCGKASITLTRAGKVVIEGTYVLSRSSGVNRIKGGSVQLN